MYETLIADSFYTMHDISLPLYRHSQQYCLLLSGGFFFLFVVLLAKEIKKLLCQDILSGFEEEGSQHSFDKQNLLNKEKELSQVKNYSDCEPELTMPK